MYSNLELFKQYIGVSGNEQDQLLTSFLQTAYQKINKLCWVDSFLLKDREQMVDLRAIVESSRGLEVYLKNKPVKLIKKINGEAYTGVKGKDYLVIYDRRVIFQRLPLNDFWFLSFEYEAWYNEQDIPDDLKLMEMMIASGMWQQHGNEWVQSYKLGDEQIVFGSASGGGADDQFFSFKTLLNKYKNFNLPV